MEKKNSISPGLIIAICLFISVTSSHAEYQSDDRIPTYYDHAISIAVNNLVRHEKRFLSQSDMFEVSITPQENRLHVSPFSLRIDGDYMSFVAFVSPKDTTVHPDFFQDENRLSYTWLSPSSDTILVVNEIFDTGEYTVSYSLEDVMFDYSLVPNKMLTASGKLFVWREDSCDESKDVIDTLIELNRINFRVKGINGPAYYFDGGETISFDLEALQQGTINKTHGYWPWGYGFRARFRRAWYLLWHSN